jgi:hypothetical protein
MSFAKTLLACLLLSAAPAVASTTIDPAAAEAVAVGLPTGNFFTNVRFGSTTADFENGTLLTLGTTANINVPLGQEVLLGASFFGSVPDVLQFDFSAIPGLTPVSPLPLACVIATSGGFNCTQRVTFNQAGSFSGSLFVDLLNSNPDYREVTTGPATGNGALFNFNLVVGPAAAPVPEPSTWAMMLLGFGLVGAALRRRGAGAAQPAPAKKPMFPAT